MGCDRAAGAHQHGHDRFQSTHPRGVRRGRGHVRRTVRAVSIHAPAWGATRSRTGFAISINSFNPRTRVGCDGRRTMVPLELALSFNPRTRVGCDLLTWKFIFNANEFQSTHPRGVRRWQNGLNGRRKKFQSTHPRGVRLPVVYQSRGHVDVSIHAPAWGATSGPQPVLRIAQKFQSTHPRGVRRPTDGGFILRRTGFNPRTRVGCDGILPRYFHPGGGFNPRTRVGCDTISRSSQSRSFRFNPRTRVGCDPHCGSTDLQGCWFQSTHPRGVRRGPEAGQ